MVTTATRLDGKRGISLVLRHVVGGALVALLLLHPATMAIYWFEFNPYPGSSATVFRVVAERVFLSFTPMMLTMAGLFALGGSLLGLGSGLYYRALKQGARQIKEQEAALHKSLHSLIEAGESSSIEFKSSIRWDHKQAKLNKALEHSAIKTLAGFMNGSGGILLLGIADDGTALGLESDYATLKKPDSDGYQQHLMNLVATRIGASYCELVSAMVRKVDGVDVCMATIEPAPLPAYVKYGDSTKYFLRTGNSTRELNVEGAVQHITRRFGIGRS